MKKKGCKIIMYDFKNKKKIEDFIKYRWTCSCCQSQVLFDSRNPKNVGRLEVPLNLPKFGVFRVNICEGCVSEMNTALVESNEGYV